MANYWTPVFTLSKDEGPDGGDFKRVDAFGITDSEGDYSGAIRYEMREGPDQFLKRIEDLDQMESIDQNKLQLEFSMDYEQIVEMNEKLRASGLDRERGIINISRDKPVNSTYRVEFYDDRGVLEEMTRWNGTVPDQTEFQEVFNTLEGLAMEYIFDDTSAEITFQAYED